MSGCGTERRREREAEREFLLSGNREGGREEDEGIGKKKKKKNMNSSICAGCRKKIAFGKS